MACYNPCEINRLAASSLNYAPYRNLSLKKHLLGLSLLLLVSGCVSNQAVQTVQVSDVNLSCPALQAELTQLGAKFENVKDDSGVTGKNIGLALVFWPGIIVNEVRSSKNQDSIDSRITHLSGLYNGKCLEGDVAGTQSGNLAERLQELKDLHDKGLISDTEYQAARERAIGSL